ncbi:activator protein [Frankia sp. CcI49]|uniref:DNA-binding transcriptional activator of the SARP family n=1 Tax=Parafrankia irregularis TaxID=795642 RepID=A0A0S4QUU2_9ACTN|nr:MULTISPECIES: AfsR/SARP family transcriptional regulator [Frankiaceae]MBE3205840.1 AfsR/SARP family transcriptional regulator [Parafrankia sp. CH37]ONH59802.1 activator protein [Frankia sp. CcI49]CUU58214.1 DNA-binding transcriptional activator of the SARP family [Parafrankia irregularis]
MRYEILGPLRVTKEDGTCFISAPKMETLLATLLVRPNEVVSADQLISEIWGAAAPRSANAGIHVMVSNLRKFLARPDRTDSPIVTRAPGYLLDLGDDTLDAHDFLDLAARGHEHVRLKKYAEAVACFDRALGLWRGQLLGRPPASPMIVWYDTWLAEQRLGCLEANLEAELELGRHRRLVPRLYSLITEHPLHEPFYRHLMVALYRAERVADALDVYRTARTRLRDELGLEPCRSLQDTQRAILVGDRRMGLVRLAG